MTPNSFNIDSSRLNSYDKWGLKVISHDPFSPEKRSRDREIPFRDGTVAMGEERFYKNRVVNLECQLAREPISREELREIASRLSQPFNMYLWDEPGKYYRAELFEPADVAVFPQRVLTDFTLKFICEPFAYGSLKSAKLSEGINQIEYLGTAKSPTLIIIRNPNSFPISGIAITAVQKIKKT